MPPAAARLWRTSPERWLQGTLEDLAAWDAWPIDHVGFAELIVAADRVVTF